MDGKHGGEAGKQGVINTTRERRIWTKLLLELDLGNEGMESDWL